MLLVPLLYGLAGSYLQESQSEDDWFSNYASVELRFRIVFRFERFLKLGWRFPILIVLYKHIEWFWVSRHRSIPKVLPRVFRLQLGHRDDWMYSPM